MHDHSRNQKNWNKGNRRTQGKNYVLLNWHDEITLC